MGGFFKSIAKGLGSAFGVAGKIAGSIPGVGTVGQMALDGLGSVLSGAASSAASASDARASLRAQNEMLQKQQQFSHDEAELNRQFQREMFDTTNAYNSPKAQVARMVEAGLNPALMYGSGAGSIAAQSPSGSAASAPSSPSPQGLSDLSLRAAEIARINAETSLIKSQTKNTDASTAGQLTFNDFQAQLLTGQIETNSMTVKLGNSQLSLNDSQQKILHQSLVKLQKECDVLDSTVKEIKAKTANLAADTYSKCVHTFLDSAIAKSQIQKMASECHLNYTQAKTLVQDILIKSRLADSQIAVNDETIAGIKIQNGRLQFDFDIDKGENVGSFRYLERKMLQSAGTVQFFGTLGQMFNEWLHD